MREVNIIENTIKGKVVFITGAAQGIGYKIGEYFAENKANVILKDLIEEEVRKAANYLTLRGIETIGIRLDVTKEIEMKRAVELAINRFGRIDILINNAGTQHISLIETFPVKQFKRLTDIMLTGPFIATK